MLKSRALILSGSNGDNESPAPCWCQQTDRRTEATHRAGTSPLNSSSTQATSSSSSTSPASFLHPLSSSQPPSSTSSHISATSLLSPLPSCLVFLPLSVPHPPSPHTHTYVSNTLPLSHLTLINGDLRKWQHHYSCSVATPPRTEKKGVRVRMKDRKGGRWEVEQEGTSWRCLLRSWARILTSPESSTLRCSLLLWKIRTTVDSSCNAEASESFVLNTNHN